LMSRGEPRAIRAEARDTLVGDHQPLELVADLAHGLEPADGRNDDAAGGEDGLHDHRGHGVRLLALDRLPELGGATAHQLLVGARPALAIGMRRRDLAEARHLEWRVGLAPLWPS